MRKLLDRLARISRRPGPKLIFTKILAAESDEGPRAGWVRVKIQILVPMWPVERVIAAIPCAAGKEEPHWVN